MKKIIAMLLVLVMSVTGLVGCGSSNKSGSEAGSTSTSSDSDWAYIQGKGKLTVGITLFAPMNYYNEKNELVGFDTEMAQAVAKKLGIDVGIGDIVGGRDYLTGMYDEQIRYVMQNGVKQTTTYSGSTYGTLPTNINVTWIDEEGRFYEVSKTVVDAPTQ